MLSDRYLDGAEAVPGSRIAVAGELYYKGFKTEANLRKVAALRDLARERSVSVSGLALAWLRDHPSVTAPIISPSKPEQWSAVREALEIDDISVAAGTIAGLIGPNGAGKSTVGGLISGNLRPLAGTISLGGEDLTNTQAYQRARRGLARTFQLPHEFGQLTTLENLVVAVPNQQGESTRGILRGRAYWRRQEEELIDRGLSLLQLFGMRDKADSRARQLSGGQKRMLDTMRALMLQPKVLLLDEPMAGLSPALMEHFENACSDLRKRGLTILLIEHDLASVERLCDHVVVMARGKVLAKGPMSELRRNEEVQHAYFVG